jgi:predicted nucleotidyltransferase
LIDEAKRRVEIFRNLDHYLRIIYQTIKELDRDAEIYLFGSVAENRHLVSSDIDILVVTSLRPELVISRLWERGIGDPFEIHVVDRERLQYYLRNVRNLIKIEFSA